MSTAQVVYTNVPPGASLHGSLFAGLKFWVAHRVPSRSHYCDEITSNGGEIVMLEKQADYLIADHARREVPVGSISYKFIEQSLKQSTILDPSEFLCGPPVGSVRPVGSTTSKKSTRTPFTAADDEYLVNWVQQQLRQGGLESGNVIYKELAQINQRHPWQSWRDRWLKYLRKFHYVEAAEPAMVSPRQIKTQSPKHSKKEQKIPASATSDTGQNSADPLAPLSVFTAVEFHELFRVAKDIQGMVVREARTAFVEWARHDGKYEGEAWLAFWNLRVQPVFETIESVTGRMRVYKRMWIEWESKNPDKRADDWLEYWERKVKPEVEKIQPPENESDEGEKEDWNNDGEPEEEEPLVEELEDREADAIELPEHRAAKAEISRVEYDEEVANDSILDESIPQRQERYETQGNSYTDLQRSRHKRSRDEEIQESPQTTKIHSKKPRTDGYDNAIKAAMKLNVQLKDQPRSSFHEEGMAKVVDSPSNSSDYELDDKEISQRSKGEKGFARGNPEVTVIEDEFEDDEIYEDNQDLGREPSPTLSFNYTAQLSDPFQETTQRPYTPPIHVDDDNYYENGSIASSPPQPPQSLDTQGILNAPTQLYDLSLPNLDMDDDDLEEYDDADHYRPESDGDLQKTYNSTSNQTPLSTHINNLIEAGHSEMNVLLALKSTSMDRELAHIVLESLEDGLGIPSDIPGVWTKEDDVNAEGGDAKKIRQVREKHGEAGLGGYLGRLEFLRRWRE